ncbi:FG-GAP-like repeat-containing protein [Nonomuraea turcica]|uniref:FG-GAP-like repeat-containing protein n=1 Tax=Nonomuraea sp. G32 TaxID=3067274 RepID=UPI00273CF29C|nr:FG-GAP-like repeat-containing protein [Nonomuraea sp. G32]MDP4509397.1 FG-GAP-like repeat-containing protein [Nonomuraea sp. G32]
MGLSPRWVTLGVAAAMAASLSVAVGPAPASASAISPPSLVDNGIYPYPGAAEILAAQNVRLISGDGHILLVDCATPVQGDIGLLKIYTTDETIGPDGFGRLCFKVAASSGVLNLEVPGVYEIRGDGQREGTGHQVTAKLRNDDGENLTVNVDPDGSTSVGLGTDPDASPTMLLQLRAGTGPAPGTGPQAAVGKLAADGRECTATLVAPLWALGAASCLATDPNQPQLTEGAPASATYVAFPGKAATKVDWLSPRAGRDVVLARLATPVEGITPIPVATAAPTGVELSTVGYSRAGMTATDWTTDQQRSAQVTFTGATATTLSTAAGPLVCSGMAGAPVLNGGKIAAVLSQAGQAGCPDTAGSDSALTAARTDDLATWVNAITTAVADHTWTLADLPATATPGTAVSTSADSAFTGTGLPLTATAGATWKTGDTFSPAVELNGTTGTLSARGPAVVTDADFSLSARAKPAAGGTVLSQDGVNTAGFKLWAENGSWRFAMSRSDVASPVWDTAIAPAGSAPAGVWSQVAVTYKAATGVAILWVNGRNVASVRHTVKWKATGALRAGAHKTGAASLGGHFKGVLSTLQTWNRLSLTPALNNHDFDGDGRNDVIISDGAGDLWMYPNQGGSGLTTVSVSNRVKIGSGWGSLRWIVTDWDADGLADVVMSGSDGVLWMYPNQGGSLSSSGKKQIGTGWANYVHAAGNANSIPHADLFGINKSNGALYYYPDGGGKTQIGTSGWTDFRIFPADFSGDNRADVMAIDTSGELWFYANTSQNGVTLAGRTQSGTGWSNYKAAAMDLSGDGKTDLVALDGSGDLWVYPGNGNGRFGSRSQIGVGWTVTAIG